MFHFGNIYQTKAGMRCVILRPLGGFLDWRWLSGTLRLRFASPEVAPIFLLLTWVNGLLSAASSWLLLFIQAGEENGWRAKKRELSVCVCVSGIIKTRRWNQEASVADTPDWPQSEEHTVCISVTLVNRRISIHPVRQSATDWVNKSWQHVSLLHWRDEHIRSEWWDERSVTWNKHKCHISILFSALSLPLFQLHHLVAPTHDWRIGTTYC